MSVNRIVLSDRIEGDNAAINNSSEKSLLELYGLHQISCFPHSAKDNSLTALVICTVFVLVGIFYSLFGYRCLKTSMFITGFIFGSCALYAIWAHDAILPPYANIGIALGAGILFGLLSTLVRYVGLFLIGFQAGILTCMAEFVIMACVNYKFTYISYNICFIITHGAIFSLFTLYWQKGFVIYGTGIYGAAITAGSIDYLLEKILMVKWIWEKAFLKRTIEPCLLSWIIFSMWPLVLITSLVIQYGITGSNDSHKNGSSKRSRYRHTRRTHNEESEEMKQKRYRHLYQVRTAHGDVISQNYVQALQRKGMMPGGGGMMMTMENSTLQSDATHFTTLPVDHQTSSSRKDDECTITVDSIQYDNGFHHNNNLTNSNQSHFNLMYH